MTLPADDVELDGATLRRLAREVADLFAEEVLTPPAVPLRHASPEELERMLPPLGEKGQGAEALLGLLRDGLLPHTRSFRHGRHFGHQKPAPLAVSSLAALIVDTLNTGGSLFEGAPYAVALEQHLVGWMARCVGLPDGAGGSFVSGGAEANLTALLCARDAAARQARARGEPAPRHVLVNAEAHYSLARAAHVLGLGDGAIIKVANNARGEMDMAALAAALGELRARGERPLAVVGIAATTPTGSFDDLPTIARLAREHGAWFHVDAAHGGSFVFSERLRHLLDGIEHADSVTWDPHKMMWVAAACSVVLVRRRADLLLAMAPGLVEASYLVREPDAVLADVEAYPHDPLHWTLACSRTLHAIKAYAVLLVHGSGGLARRIERCCDLARACDAQVRATDDFEPIGFEPPANIVCFRHVPPSLRGDETAIDRHNFALRDALAHGEHAYLTGTRAGGRYWLRAVVMSAPVTELAFAELLTELRRLAARA